MGGRICLKGCECKRHSVESRAKISKQSLKDWKKDFKEIQNQISSFVYGI